MNNQSLWDLHGQQSTPNRTPLTRTRPVAFKQPKTQDPVTTGHDQATEPVVTGKVPRNDQSEKAIPGNLDQHRPDATSNNSSEEQKITGRDRAHKPDASGQKVDGAEDAPVIVDGEETMTILEATAYLQDKGFDQMKPRNVQRYCTGKRRKGQLKCYWHDTSNQHLVSKPSLEKFADILANELSSESLDRSSKNQEVVDPKPQVPPTSEISKEEEQEDLRKPHFEDIFDHPYVKKLEGQVKEYQGKWEKQVEKTESIQRQHSQDLSNMHQQSMVATSKQFAKTYLELTAGGSGSKVTPDDPDFNDEDLEDDQ